ncbi:MAG: ABC transporter permease [Alphaproteobacteria bacterium]|nr:ABC transporter permease [Alphaproteobacteria bacterium]
MPPLFAAQEPAAAAAAPSGTSADETLSPTRLAWRSFRRRKLGLVGTAMVLLLVLVAIGGTLITPYDPNGMNASVSMHAPGLAHPAGTDRFGRDQLSRLMEGTRISMLVSFGSVLLSLAMGLPLGLIAGYYGGLVSAVIMRTEDVVFAFPTILLALMIVATLGPSLINLVLAIAIIFQANVARVVRASVMSVKEKEFVEAARAVAARDAVIMARFILPNVMSPVIVQATFHLSLAIFIEASLSFLGLGAQPPTPSWGLMLNESRTFMEFAPWLTVFPGLAIIFAVLAFNLMGDALRDALDPRLSER